MDKILVIQLTKSKFFLTAHGVQLDNGMTPRDGTQDTILVYPYLLQLRYVEEFPE